jgi:ribA/ribD-fused uncharacterized protein
MGRQRTRPLRPDWEQVKEDIMQKAVLRKFETHADIREVLLSTKDAEIVENSLIDYYWGCGANGSGKNRLVPLRGSQKSKVKSQKAYNVSFSLIWNGWFIYADLY